MIRPGLPKLVATDLDGTLVRSDEMGITPLPAIARYALGTLTSGGAAIHE